MLTPNLIEKIMVDVAECTSRRSGLLLSQVEMAYPQSPNRSLVRRAILNTFGDSGLLPEIRSILSVYLKPTHSDEVNHVE